MKRNHRSEMLATLYRRLSLGSLELYDIKATDVTYLRTEDGPNSIKPTKSNCVTSKDSPRHLRHENKFSFYVNFKRDFFQIEHKIDSFSTANMWI